MRRLATLALVGVLGVAATACQEHTPAEHCEIGLMNLRAFHPDARTRLQQRQGETDWCHYEYSGGFSTMTMNVHDHNDTTWSHGG